MNASNLSECKRLQEMWPDLVDRQWIQAVFAVVYTVIWFMAVAGNVLVIYVAGCKNVSFTVRNVFILSLASSDLLIANLSLPVTAVTIFSRRWLFPKPLCFPIGSIQGSGIFISSFTLTAIAVDRYLLIVHPSRAPHISYGRALAAVVLIWLSGYLFTSPLAIFTSIITYVLENGQPICGHFCEEKWWDQDAATGQSTTRRIYGMTVVGVQFSVPVVICAFCYCSISLLLGRQIRRRRENQVMLADSERRLIARRSRTNRMMFAMVASFVLAWLPLNFINFVRDFMLYDLVPQQHYSLVFAFGHAIAMTSGIWNPIIYGWFNPQFRRALQLLLPRFLRKQPHDHAVPIELHCTANRA